jgi:hypothetical protein
MVSKNLLADVLGIKVLSIHGITRNHFGMQLEFHSINSEHKINEKDHINIFELANKCKIWTWNRHQLTISSSICGYIKEHKHYPYANVLGTIKGKEIDEDFFADNEPAAIFKACEWIVAQL